jgi:hypothetical protein
MKPTLRKDAPRGVPLQGFYIEGEAEGAYPNGTRVIKIDAEESDSTRIGTKGTVISSVDASDVEIEGVRRITYFYFVMWDDFPAPVGLADWKIGKEDAL